MRHRKRDTLYTAASAFRISQAEEWVACQSIIEHAVEKGYRCVAWTGELGSCTLRDLLALGYVVIHELEGVTISWDDTHE